MSGHAATVAERWKMDAHAPLFSWTCVCGQTGNILTSSRKQAQESGDQHADAKNAAESAETGA